LSATAVTVIASGLITPVFRGVNVMT
jgi:hypothetical protein